MISQHAAGIPLLIVLFLLHRPLLVVAASAPASFDLSQLWALLVQFVPLPILFAILGTSVGKFLAQQHFPKLVNDLIAFVFVLGAAIFDAFMSHQVSATTDWLNLVSIVSGLFTLLVAGPLSSLKPYMAWLDFLQNAMFNIVKPPVAVAPPPSTASRVSNAYTPTSTGPTPLLFGKGTSPQSQQPPTSGSTDTSG
jgi:hypothetical protein